MSQSQPHLCPHITPRPQRRIDPWRSARQMRPRPRHARRAERIEGRDPRALPRLDAGRLTRAQIDDRIRHIRRQRNPVEQRGQRHRRRLLPARLKPQQSRRRPHDVKILLQVHLPPPPVDVPRELPGREPVANNLLAMTTRCALDP